MRNTTKTIIKTSLFGATLCAAIGLAEPAKAEPMTHDGFYLSLDAGLGYLSSSYEVGPVKTTLSGVTTPFALWLGGTVGPVVIGGGFFGDHAASPSGKSEGGGVTSSGDLGDVTLTLIGIGMFADIYINPKEGLHFQPFVGWGGLESSVNGNSGGSDPTGLVLALGAGYEFWVADQWSIGPMFRFAYAPLSYESVDFPTIAPALLCSFTYH